MVLFYKKSKYSDPELEAAIELMSKEHPIVMRNTAKKMSKLIHSELDVKVDISRIKRMFGFTEDYEKESLKIEHS
tara:strand:+ start:136 stop:360 length:225 start_codon:yes stop_codon:yes gene_type:complete